MGLPYPRNHTAKNGDRLLCAKARSTFCESNASLLCARWKDTIRAHSKMITRIIVRFEGYTGRSVWHCHLREHEDYEMMRPYDVLGEASGSGGTVLSRQVKDVRF
jgi:FtsP/CotA-like multicopper oxidase with cupredoxin domain